MNHSLLLLCFPFYPIALGSLSGLKLFLLWETYCVECGRTVKSPQGLFCTNYSSPREDYPACHRGWCAKCYKAPENLEFYFHREENEVNLVWKKKGEERRYLEGIGGAFLVTPFQCDHCWFVNLEQREPNLHSFNDLRLLGYIRRANLDVIWLRAPGTIANVKMASSI
mmetsp:Transcript_22242/g.31293  ORF Transcript_22242/g.31293 Transcript_22242/m.31293 type:complete len:168 (+) Transcript_22242:2478-2981(+)